MIKEMVVVAQKKRENGEKVVKMKEIRERESMDDNSKGGESGQL